MKYTPEGLPFITKATTKVYLRDLSKRKNEDSREEFETESLNRITKDNPNLDKIIDMYLLDEQSSEKCQGFIAGAMHVYELLRRQAESNKMEE